MTKRVNVKCLLVCGTNLFNNPTAPKWMREGSELRQTVLQKFPNMKIDEFLWNGAKGYYANSQEARYRSAKDLGRKLQHDSENFDHTVVIGHSHGGNVALQAMNEIDTKNMSLVTLGTPFFHVEKNNIEKVLTYIYLYWTAIPYLSLFVAWWICMGIFHPQIPFFGLHIEFPLNFMAYSAVWILGLALLSLPLMWKAPLFKRAKEGLSKISAWYDGLEVQHPINICAIYYPIEARRDEVFSCFSKFNDFAKRRSARSQYHTDALMDASDHYIESEPNRIPMILLVILTIFAALYIMTGISGFVFNETSQFFILGISALLALGLMALVILSNMRLVVREIFAAYSNGLTWVVKKMVTALMSTSYCSAPLLLASSLGIGGVAVTAYFCFWDKTLAIEFFIAACIAEIVLLVRLLYRFKDHIAVSISTTEQPALSPDIDAACVRTCPIEQAWQRNVSGWKRLEMEHSKLCQDTEAINIILDWINEQAYSGKLETELTQ